MYCLLLCFVLSDILFHLTFSYSKQKTKYTKGFRWYGFWSLLNKLLEGRARKSRRAPQNPLDHCALLSFVRIWILQKTTKKCYCCIISTCLPLVNLSSYVLINFPFTPTRLVCDDWWPLWREEKGNISKKNIFFFLNTCFWADCQKPYQDVIWILTF